MMLSWVRRLAGAAAALALVFGVSARAAAACAGPELIPLAIGAALIPSEAGAVIATDDAARTKALIGWSWQIPVGPSSFDVSRHRIVPGVEVLPGPGGVTWRARIGYRYDTGRFLVGVGPEADNRGSSLSPELGIKFLHAQGDSMSLHAIARAQVAPDGLRGVTFMLGWNML